MLDRPILTPELRECARKMIAEVNRLYDEDPYRRGMSAEELMERARRNRARQISATREDSAED